jgi:hypothetical protein
MTCHRVWGKNRQKNKKKKKKEGKRAIFEPFVAP